MPSTMLLAGSEGGGCGQWKGRDRVAEPDVSRVVEVGRAKVPEGRDGEWILMRNVSRRLA